MKHGQHGSGVDQQRVCPRGQVKGHAACGAALGSHGGRGGRGGRERGEVLLNYHRLMLLDGEGGVLVLGGVGSVE